MQVGSVFEFTNKNPIFGVVQPDSFLYGPILGIFALTGLPTAGWLFYKAISSANAEADRQDKIDSGMP
jgi:vacuolar iron transporter family protein